MSKPTSALKKSLGLRDLILLNVSCIVGLSTLSQAAQLGYAIVLLYGLAILFFLIPAGLMVAELNARIPEEGGFYVWTKKAFGDMHGYIAAWSYWLSNIVWFPTILLLITSSAHYLFGDAYLYLMDDYTYYGTVSMIILWLVILLNIFGLERAKWIQNVGGMATWMAIILLLALGVYAFFVMDITNQLEVAHFLPDFSDFSLLPFFAAIAFGFGGLELGSVMSEEVEKPSVNIPRSIFLSSIIVGVLYTIGTLMIVVILPSGEISVIEAIAQAFYQIGSDLNMVWIGVAGSLLVVLGTVGQFGAWMTGTARIPFVIGIDHYLPDVVAKVHPKWGSPYVSLVMQGVVVSVLFLASTAGSTLKEAFLILYDMSIILFFIPYLYMFASLVVHHRRNTGGKGVITWWGNKQQGVYLIAGAGFCITLFSVIVSSMPSSHIENEFLFVLKVVGGAILLNLIGLVAYWLRHR